MPDIWRYNLLATFVKRSDAASATDRHMRMSAHGWRVGAASAPAPRDVIGSRDVAHVAQEERAVVLGIMISCSRAQW
jgi:hypothetical protein